MPAQATKQRTGRYNRQTALSQSRRNQNIKRSTSPYGRNSGYQSRTSAAHSSTSSRVMNSDYRYNNTNFAARQRTASQRDGYYTSTSGRYNDRAASPSSGVYYSNTMYGNTSAVAYSRPRFTATDELSGIRRSAAADANPQTKTPVVKEAESLIRRMSREERAIAGKKAKSRVYYIIGIAVLFLMCISMIYRQTAIFGMNQEIDKLNSEYNGILVTNESIQSSIDKSVELGNLESVAKNELGMIAPDSSQVFYIDMGNRDEVVKSGK